MEKWKEIQCFDLPYYISNYGRVKNKDGKYVGYVGKDKYVHLMVKKDGKPKNIRVHRLVWECFGCKEIKEGTVIDHIDNVKHNNHIDNLQVIPFRDNCHKDTKTPISGVIGVSWNSQKNKWKAQISIKNKRRSLGYRQTIMEAKILYDNALTQSI